LSVDDLRTWQGVVLGRAVSTLRSVERLPSIICQVTVGPSASVATPLPSPLDSRGDEMTFVRRFVLGIGRSPVVMVTGVVGVGVQTNCWLWIFLGFSRHPAAVYFNAMIIDSRNADIIQ
jgi:hypothetical protein